jgi:TrmH family RNA methyltransferase
LLSARELDNLRVVLVSTRNPLNIGAAARIMANFGFQHLRVVKPYDVAFREARSGVGAASLLASAEEYDAIADAVGDCSLVVGTTTGRGRALDKDVHPVMAGADLIREHLQQDRAALLFGSEKRGLSNRDFSHCDWLMHIPTFEQTPSLNLAQAVAVCVYELSRDPGSMSALLPSRRANAAELERVTSVLLECLKASGYITDESAAARTTKARHLVRRLNLNEKDAELVLGMLRQIAWKLNREP